MITIIDVAREADVSISTVSNVVNGVDKVKPETRDRVLEVVRRLNYFPNSNAQYLKTGKRNTIGLFVSSIQGAYYTTLAQTIHLQCKLAGYMLNIYVSNDNTCEDVFVNIASSGVAGAIIMNESLNDPYIEKLRFRGLPMVFIDRVKKGPLISSVIINDYLGVSQAMEYLIGQGHRRIGFIRGLKNRDGQERWRAYQDVMQKHSLPVDESIVLEGVFEEIVAFSRMQQFLIRSVPVPDAFYCANDEMAWGCIRALRDKGITVPGQVSVMGFDNIPMSAYYSPPLTTVYNPVTELGTQSALELIRLMKSEKTLIGANFLMEPRLVIRDSCVTRTG